MIFGKDRTMGRNCHFGKFFLILRIGFYRLLSGCL